MPFATMKSSYFLTNRPPDLTSLISEGRKAQQTVDCPLGGYRASLLTQDKFSRFIGENMAAEDKDLVEILEDLNPIDVAKYMNYVSAPQAGAIATFSGTTRDTFEGKTVLELRYEAYVPMAIRCLKSLCSSARASWNLHSIAVAHRLGTVPVGETSVFVAVSAVHRADALEASRFLIDELKATVPIWKKEVYTNGEVWKENSEFMERRSELGKNDEDFRGKATEMKEHNRKHCCRPKVQVKDEVKCED